MAHVLPPLAIGVLIAVLKPVTAPILAFAILYAWTLPELYAARGANVLRARPGGASADAEQAAFGLLADLLDHGPRELQRQSGLALERAELGAWIVGEAGAVLVRPRRVYCYCVKVADGDLPAADRIAHLLLALRADERGFATVANLAFSGARWRLRRRLPKPSREALDAAAAHIRAAHQV